MATSMSLSDQDVGLGYVLIALRLLGQLRRRDTTFDQLLLASVRRESLSKNGTRLGDVDFCLLDRGLGTENGGL